MGRASLRSGNLSAVQARLWIRYHWKKKGLTHLIPEFSDAEEPGLDQLSLTEIHGSMASYARIQHILCETSHTRVLERGWNGRVFARVRTMLSRELSTWYVEYSGVLICCQCPHIDHRG